MASAQNTVVTAKLDWIEWTKMPTECRPGEHTFVKGASIRSCNYFGRTITSERCGDADEGLHVSARRQPWDFFFGRAPSLGSMGRAGQSIRSHLSWNYTHLRIRSSSGSRGPATTSPMCHGPNCHHWAMALVIIMFLSDSLTTLFMRERWAGSW